MRIVKFLILLNIILTSSLIVVHCRRILRLTRFVCIVHNPVIAQNISCSFKIVNRTTTLINISGYIAQTLNDIVLNGQVFRKSEIHYRPYLVNSTTNFCDFMEKNRGDIYMRILEKMYKPYSTFNHTCPYSGYFLVKDLPVDASKLPDLVPVGEYRLDLNYFEKSTKLMTTKSFAELVVSNRL